MSWAGRRRALIIAIASLTGVAALLILGFSIFYDVPTCIDRKQNQDELGVDCGGSCTTLCASQVSYAPVVRFARALEPQPGRTDIIAYIDNGNSNAQAKGASFLLEVYNSERALIAKKSISVDLPQSMSVPVYLPDVTPRGSHATQVFLTPVSESTTWSRIGERLILPSVEDISVNEGLEPRITATLANPIARPIYNTTLVATVFDVSGNAIAASQTFVPTLPSQGTSPIVFTWNAPFPTSVARVEILPVPQVAARAP